MPDRLLVDLNDDGRVAVSSWPDSALPQEVSRASLAWPLDAGALEDLRWYLEDYLQAPYGVWEDRGPAIQSKLAGWGEAVFASVFGSGAARYAYERARDKGLEVVFRSADPGLLALPWELMRDSAGPVALGASGISRSLPVAGGAGTLAVPGGRLRVLMVISRPAGASDVGYQVVARPFLARLEAVRGEVDLTVLRPPTFDALAEALVSAASKGDPFHVVHFDGHGVMPGHAGSGGAVIGGRAAMVTAPGQGVLVFEKPGGGSDHVTASKVAAALAEGKVPVVVLNACQSGAVGKDLEASVATALLKAGCAAVVAMAYSVYAIAAAEFMASFYETLFTGASVGRAVTAGRKRLAGHDARPSPKGDMSLADWLVPVHYMRKDVSFPQARTTRPASAPSLDAALDQIRTAPSGLQPEAVAGPLAAMDGLFVGRDDLFYQLEIAARLQHVVVLSGPGGTGKTELAKGFARWWRDTGGVDDPRLVIWHSFEPGLATFGLDGVITTLGLTVFGPGFARSDAAERLAQVKRLMAQLRLLLVWDNFEIVHDMPDPAGATPPMDEAGCAQLREFLEWVRNHSRSTVVITSRAREDWLGQVRRIEVGELNRQEAAEYADHLLAPYTATHARREGRAFGDLLEWLDGHPLAMRLTLPRLDTTDPADLLAGLHGTTPLPAGDIGPGRLSSLGACITYSFTHLSEATRRLVPAVSLFHGIADEDLLMLFSAVESVPGRFAGVSKQEWTAVLEDATRVGLLTGVGAGMYRIHPALAGYLTASWHTSNPAGYAREREAGEQALCTATAMFSRWLTGQIETGNAGVAYAILGWQRRTLGAMLGHALGHHTWHDAEAIVRALDAYWDTRGLGQEADAWADRILDVTTPGQDTPAAQTPAASLWLYTITQQATRQNGAGQPEQAADTYRRALTYLQGQPETRWTRSSISVLYHQLGITATDRRRLDEAEDWYRKSLTIDEELADRPGMTSTYHQLGNTAYRRGHLDEADGWYRKSLTIREELGDRPGMADTYHQLGMTAQARGHLDEADGWYRKSLTIREELGDRPGMARSYHQLGDTAYRRGYLDEAENWYRKSLAIAEEFGDRPGMARSYHQLGMTAQDRGHLDEADDWYRKSLTIREELADRPGMADTYHQFGNTAYLRWQLDEADDWYRKSLTIRKELADRPGMADTYHQLGMTAQARGQLNEADDWYRKSLAINEELGDRRGMSMTFGQLGLLAEALEQPGQVLSWTVRCVALFSEFPHPATGPGPRHLARLTRDLGLPALEQAWRQVTGQPLPQPVRDYVTRHHDNDPGDAP